MHQILITTVAFGSSSVSTELIHVESEASAEGVLRVVNGQSNDNPRYQQTAVWLTDPAFVRRAKA